MTTVHRFTDPEYADLTVRMRAGENPALLFDQLYALGLIQLHASVGAEEEAIALTALDGATVAITAATNDEARELNARVRTERVHRGDVDDIRTSTGSDGLAIGTSDLIQTRKNDSQLQVANRQNWTVQRVEDDGTVWAREASSGRAHQHTIRLPSEYVTEYTHLAYASTAYGVQGATVTESHTLLSDAIDAAGVYVGITRGRTSNRLHIVAADLDDAREQLANALERDRADRGLVEATRAAHEAVHGLVAHGPARLVNTERARLAQLIEHADQQATHWGHAIAILNQQQEAHQTDQARQDEIGATADARAAQVRAVVAAPLIEKGVVDGTAYLAARERMWEATAARSRAGRLGKRTADRAAVDAADAYRTIQDTVLAQWGDVPQTASGISSWAEIAAGRRADTDRRVTETRVDAEHAQHERWQLTDRHLRESAVLHRQVLGSATPSTASTRATQWRTRAKQGRRDLAQIEALPVTEAALLIRDRTARAEAERDAAERLQAARDARAVKLHQFQSPSTDHSVTRPERDTPGL